MSSAVSSHLGEIKKHQINLRFLQRVSTSLPAFLLTNVAKYTTGSDCPDIVANTIRISHWSLMSYMSIFSLPCLRLNSGPCSYQARFHHQARIPQPFVTSQEITCSLPNNSWRQINQINSCYQQKLVINQEVYLFHIYGMTTHLYLESSTVGSLLKDVIGQEVVALHCFPQSLLVFVFETGFFL